MLERNNQNYSSEKKFSISSSFSGKMRTIKEHNKVAREDWNSAMTMEHKAHVTCDECGTELEFKNSMVLTSMPPMREVFCPKCGYKGYKVC